MIKNKSGSRTKAAQNGADTLTSVLLPFTAAVVAIDVEIQRQTIPLERLPLTRAPGNGDKADTKRRTVALKKVGETKGDDSDP